MAKKKSAKPKPKTYRWDGGAKVHSISEADHKANAAGMQAYGALPNSPLAGAPLTAGQGYGMATAAADRVYQPQIQAAQQTQANIQPWYQGYIADTKARQAAAQTYAAPLLATAQQGVTNAAQTAPGLDASSPQYAKEQQAAQGRQAIAQLGASSLAAIPVATDAYFAGQQNIAARDLPQTQAYAARQVGSLQSQRGQAITDEFGRIRTGEQNYGIANATLGLNTSKAAADVDISRGVDPVTGKPLPTDAPTGYGTGAPGQNKYGYTYDEWNKLDPKAQDKAREGTGPDKAASKAAEKAKKEAEKKAADIKKATGKIKSRVTDATTAWERYARARNPKTTLDPVTGDAVPVMDPKTKKPQMVGATPDQIKAQLKKDGYSETEIHVMLMLRAGKKLTSAEIKALKDADSNIRIPNEWRTAKPKSAPVTRNAPDGYGGSRPT